MSIWLYNGNPCGECNPPKRHPGCHADCPDYKAWTDELSERKAQYRGDKAKQHMLDSMEASREKRKSKRRH